MGKLSYLSLMKSLALQYDSDRIFKSIVKNIQFWLKKNLINHNIDTSGISFEFFKMWKTCHKRNECKKKKISKARNDIILAKLKVPKMQFFTKNLKEKTKSFINNLMKLR